MIDDTGTTGASTDPQEHLIGSLRQELAEYGSLLQLHELEQEAILDRKPDSVLELVTKIEAQLALTARCRKQRAAAADALALEAGIAEPVTLRTLAPHFRPALRPLVDALIDEVNRLITLTRKRAQQNQMLLARSVELAQDLVTRLSPRSVSKTYSARGRVNIKPAAGASRLLDRS
jgi:flagellar biosynthesis/type III secretory pathway chaperone